MSLLLGYDQPLIYSRSSQLYSLKCENKIVPLTKYQTSENARLENTDIEIRTRTFQYKIVLTCNDATLYSDSIKLF